MGVIDERTMSCLSIAAELTKNIETKFSSEKEKIDAVASIMPKFMWVLKDFTLELTDNQGRNITSNDYLETCLDTSMIVRYVIHILK